MVLIYKYVSAERVYSLLPELGNGTLRATQPLALNDPFECALRGPYLLGDAARILSAVNAATPISEEDVSVAAERYGSLYLRELLSRQLSQRFGIISFSEDPRHPLMWSHYTVDGSGFVVGYDREGVMNLTERGSLQGVTYRPEPPTLMAPREVEEDTLIPLLSQKSCYWSYEQEWRLIVELNETIGTGRNDPRGLPINLIPVPNELVRSVYFTERTPNCVVDAVADRLQDSNNRYGVRDLTRLVMSGTQYGYQDAPE